MVIINKKKSTINNKNMSTINKLILLFFILFVFIPKGYSQNADPGIGILMSPASLSIGSTGILRATVGNYGNNTIVSNSLQVTISVGASAEILGIASGSDIRWSQLTLTTGSANTITLTNTGGGFGLFDVGDILLTVRGNVVSGATGIAGNIVYIATNNALLCGGCASPPLNTSQGNASNSNDNSSTSLAVTVLAVALVKTASVSGTGILGDVITYTFTVTNTGTTTLTNVVVTDPMLGLTITGSPIASLAVGASSSVITGTYTITQANINAGSVTNSATATSDEGATDISGTANDNDTATITTVTQTPAIALVKTASVSGTGILGDVITYTFTVTNTGTTTLTNVVVTDPMVGLTITGSPIASLAVGASSSVITGTYTITQANINEGSVTNSATATSDEGVSDISGTTNTNDTPTVTATPTPTLTPTVTDFTPTIDIDATSFSAAEPAKDFVLNISAIGGLASNGPVVVKISKLSAFTITYGAATSTSSVFGGTPVNNSNWTMTQNSHFITMTLKSGAIIGGSANSAIGFTITRNTTAPTQTIQSITATIVNGSGSDAVNNNNTYSTIANVQ